MECWAIGHRRREVVPPAAGECPISCRHGRVKAASEQTGLAVAFRFISPAVWAAAVFVEASGRGPLTPELEPSDGAAFDG